MAIDAQRLQHIPNEFRAQHSFCFWLHDLIADIMRQAEAARIADVHFRFENEEQAKVFRSADDPIAFLLEYGDHELAKRIVMNRIVIPLYADILHFIYEGLEALEKRKYAVAFAVFRKPFKYSLMHATWVFADENDYFERLRKSPAKLLSDGDQNLSKERRKDLLGKALALLPFSQCFSADVIYNIVYEKKNPRSLAPYFDMAAHLVTSATGIETESLNLNFIFKNPAETDIYEGIYFPIAYLTLYLLLLELEMIGRMANVQGSYRTWLTTATLASFEGLFGGGDTHLIDSVNKTWAELFTCALCGAQLQLTRDNAVLFFADEHVDCEHCGTTQQFPFFWILSKFHDGKPLEHDEEPG